MNYSKNKVSDIQIAYIGGGSRGWAWTFMTDLAWMNRSAEPSVFMTLTAALPKTMQSSAIVL